MVIGERKLIVDLDGTRHYFDRSTDPEERDSATLPESQQRQLDEALDRFLAEIGVPFEAEVAPLDDDTREELRVLGYLE